VLVSAVEHPSVQSAADELARRGHMVERIPATAAGVVDEAAFTRLLDAPPLTSAKPLHSDGTRSVPTANIALVSVMLGNNETGVLQPVKNLTAATRTRGIVFHTDAVQVVGKSPVSFRDLGVDLLSFTAHKFHGPIGIGGLLTRGDVKLEPLLFGGFQQAGLRPGTESAPLVAGLHKALEVWHKEAHERSRRMTSLREELEQQLTARVPDCIIVGCEVARLPHTTNVAFPGVDRQALVMALDLAGVSCSTGSACASGSSEPSPVLLAMGLPRAVVEGSIRLSLGATTTAAEINDAVERICRCVNQLRRA
jgi:cysteine desulfurase